MGQILLARTLIYVQVGAALGAQPLAVFLAEDAGRELKQQRSAYCLIQLEHMTRIHVLIVIRCALLPDVADKSLLNLRLDLRRGGFEASCAGGFDRSAGT